MATKFETRMRGHAWIRRSGLMGETVTYKSQNTGSGQSITAILTDTGIIEEYDEHGKVRILTKQAECLPADLLDGDGNGVSPHEDDVFVISSATWAVSSIASTTPTVVFNLERTIIKQIHGKDSRKP
jgi:hypothetical protein